AQFVEQEEAVAHVGGDDNDELRRIGLQLFQYLLQSELYADRGQSRLAALGILAAVLRTQVQRQVSARYWHLERVLARPTPLILLHSIPDIGNVRRKVQASGRKAQTSHLGGHRVAGVIRVAADAVAIGRSLRQDRYRAANRTARAIRLRGMFADQGRQQPGNLSELAIVLQCQTIVPYRKRPIAPGVVGLHV